MWVTIYSGARILDVLLFDEKKYILLSLGTWLHMVNTLSHTSVFIFIDGLSCSNIVVFGPRKYL